MKLIKSKYCQLVFCFMLFEYFDFKYIIMINILMDIVLEIVEDSSYLKY